MSGSEPAAISRGFAGTADGRSWAVYSADVPTPAGVSRAQKATDSSTPVAVALPLGDIEAGQVYAGLPVALIRSPLFANAQFDPLTSRAGLRRQRVEQGAGEPRRGGVVAGGARPL